MNKHFYRVIFNHALGLWQCVSELAKSKGKTKSAQLVTVATLLMLSGEILAVDYTGQHTITEQPYTVINDKISGQNTKITFNDVNIGDTTSGQLRVEDVLPTITGGIMNTPLPTSGNAGVETKNVKLGIHNGITGTLHIPHSDDENNLFNGMFSENMTVGVNGTGKVLLSGGRALNVNHLIVGQEKDSKNNTIEINKGKYQGTRFNVRGDAIIADKGEATVTINEGYLVANSIVTAKEQGAISTINLNGDEQIFRNSISANKNFILGQAGITNVNISAGMLRSDENMILGATSTGKGIINIDAQNNNTPLVGILAKNLIIGDAGHGAIITDNYLQEDYGRSFGETTDVVIANQTGSTGILDIKRAGFEVKNNLVVGKNGNATLNLGNQSWIQVGNIIRDSNAKTQLTIDDGKITGSRDEEHFFQGFDATTPIQIGSNGFIFEVDGEYENTASGYEPIKKHTVSIDKNAILTGKLGRFNANDLGNFKGFLKDGVGTLIIDETSKKFTGDTFIIAGKLKINGNHTMENDESLITSIIDWNGDDKIDTATEYGKFEVTGTADISKGSLKVFADDIAKALITGTTPTGEFKDVVKAGILTGRFKDVTVLDNNGNPITTSLTADYTDEKDGRVHLSFNPQNPTTDPTTGNPTTGNPTTGNPTTGNPTTGNPTTGNPTTGNPTTGNPTTGNPTTGNPTTGNPTTGNPTTGNPTTGNPTTGNPTTGNPTTGNPTTGNPTTGNPTTGNPTTGNPTTGNPTTGNPTTGNPTTGNPTTGNPTTGNPTTGNPTTGNPSVPSSVTTFTDAVKSQHNTSAENIAKVLDKAVTTPANVLGETLKLTSSTLNQAQLSDYANQLQPLMLGTTGQLFNQNQAIFAQAVQEQTLSPNRHLWAKAIYKDGELKSSTAILGVDDRHYGAIIGADTTITPKLNLGVALAYVDSQAKTHGIQQKMTSDHIQGLIYGNYQAGANTLLNFHAGIGQVDIHGERHINVPRLDALTTAQSDYKANTTQAGVGVQHRIGSEKKYVEPFAQFDYRQMTSKAYQETGSNMFNLNVDKQHHEALRWTAGVRVNQPLTQNVAVTGLLSASIEQADNPTVYATFNQFSGEKFATTGQKLGQEIGTAGLGLRYYPTAMTEISGLYQGEWRKHYHNHGALLEFKMKF